MICRVVFLDCPSRTAAHIYTLQHVNTEDVTFWDTQYRDAQLAKVVYVVG